MIIKKFLEQVNKYPSNVAVKAGDRIITYGELNTYANRVANAVRALQQDVESSREREGLNRQLRQGTRDETSGRVTRRIALLFEHGADMIIAVISALKAGMTYVPLDVTYPQKRLLYMLEDSGSSLILTNRTNSKAAKELGAQMQTGIDVLIIDDIVDKDAEDLKTLEFETGFEADGDSIAYILYTSGSTGRPKGVMQTQRNVMYFIRDWIRRFSVTESDRMTLLSAFSHDASVMDIYAALLSGAALYPYYIKTNASTNELYTLLMEEKITVWHSVPSLFRYFTGTLTEKNLFYDMRWVLLGGEQLRPHDFEMYESFFPKATLGNIYGQTECSVCSVCALSHGDIFGDLSLGEPLDETKIFLVREDGNTIETIGVGEIAVACDYIAAGYWNDEENTKRAFTRDDDWGRIYWTGDLGRLNLDGSIKVMGRKDFQIKIRGFRVETGEIESILMHHEAIKEVVTVANPDEKGDTYLCAYFVADRIITAEELRAHLSRELPDYMIPRFFVPLEKMPMTPNGKIDRRQLPEPEVTIVSNTVYVAPSNEMEEKLAAIWKEVLAIEKVGIHDNFIELGGHSLLVISIISRIQQEFNVELQLGDVFENPTVKELAQLVMASTPAIYPAIKPVEEKEYYPATSDQKRIFILSQFEGINTTYNLPAVWKVEGNFDSQYFEKTIQKLMNRHDMFRTSFKMIDDELVQVIHKTVDLPVQYIDVEKQAIRSKNTLKEITKVFIQPFDLNSAPLFRVALVKQSTDEHFLLLDFHHIITDGVSENIYMMDFYRLYLREELAGLKLRYRDYSEWQKGLESSGQLRKQEEYWLNIFKGEIPVLDLPNDYPRPAVQNFEGNIVGFVLSKEVSEQINRLAKETGTTLFMVLLAMYNVLLHKYTGQEDIVTGTIIAGRNNADLENIIGFFAKTLALRNFPTPNKPFDFFLDELRRNTLKSFENQMYPFIQLMEKLELTNDPSRNPLFDAAFVLQNTEMSLSRKQDGDIGLKFIPQGFDNNTSLFDLFFQVVELGDRIFCGFQYNTRLFKRETIELMKERFLILVKNILNCKSVGIGNIDFSTPRELKIRETEEVEFDL